MVADTEFETYFLIVDLVFVKDFHHHFVLNIGFRGVQLVEAIFGGFDGWSMRKFAIFDCSLATDNGILGKSLDTTSIVAVSGVKSCLYLDHLALSLCFIHFNGWR